MHAGQLSVAGLSDVDVERLALVDEGAPVSSHGDDHLLGNLPCCLVQCLQVIWDPLDFLSAESNRNERSVSKVHTPNVRLK